jgi:hypothetical protein
LGGAFASLFEACDFVALSGKVGLHEETHALGLLLDLQSALVT